MKALRTIALAAVAAAVLAAPATAATTTVVTFDDLSGTGLIADGYGGVNWNQNFRYDDKQYPGYPPHSGLTTVYSNYAKFPVEGPLASMAVNFLEAVQFDGAYFSGNVGFPLKFELYREGVKVATSATLSSAGVPQWLAGGYSGLVDEVRLIGNPGRFVMDDFTYTTGISSAVPEPASWALMIVGFGAAGTMVRIARRRTGAVLAV